MEFNRIIKLLRKERGITQKQAAEDLGVSQALLSHYEKGIRECGLDFVVRVADYYNVSCDYLLGRSAERNGMMLSAEDLPNPDKMKDNIYHGSVLPTMIPAASHTIPDRPAEAISWPPTNAPVPMAALKMAT